MDKKVTRTVSFLYLIQSGTTERMSKNTGQEVKKVNDEMTTKEVDRLADWLKANGHSDEEILQCIKYIAGTQQPQQKQ